jgi:hypothetical protein
MPWKVKKIRKVGPFWIETSKDGAEESIDLRTNGNKPGHRPLFGRHAADHRAARAPQHSDSSANSS